MKLIKQEISFNYRLLALIIPILFISLLGLHLQYKSISTSTQSEQTNYIHVDLVEEYRDLINKDAYKEYIRDFENKYAYSVDYIIDNDFFKGIGALKPDIDLETYSGETINLSRVNKNMALEVVADWCSFCKTESKEYLLDTINNNQDIIFVQYMLTGGKEEIDNFYSEIEMPIPGNLIIVLKNDELTSYLEKNDFTSFPTFYFFNENRCVGAQIGALASEYFEAVKYLVYGKTPLYELKTTSDTSLAEAVQRIKVAKEYLANLTSVDVPKEYFVE